MNKRKWKFNFGSILYLLHFFSVLHQNSAKMHSCTYVISLFFLEKKEWNLNCFHFFREMKSEIIFLFTLFEKWKVNWFLISLFSRSESEIEKPRDRDREVKYEKNSRETRLSQVTATKYDHLAPTKTSTYQNQDQFRPIFNIFCKNFIGKVSGKIV